MPRKVLLFLKIVHSFWVINFLSIQFFTYSLIILCISIVPIVIFPFSFLDTLFFLISLARGLYILFIFSKNQLLLSLILSIVLFFLILFIYALIFIMSLLILMLGLICSFTSFINYEFRLFIWDCSSFLR